MSFYEQSKKSDSVKIVIIELDIPLSNRNHNVESGIWGFNPSPGSQDVVDDFGNVGFYGDRNDEYKNIQSLNVAGEQYPEFASLALLRAATKGWFYDSTIPFINIKLESWNPPEYYIVVAPGAADGYTYGSDRTAKNYYEDIHYPSLLISAPSLAKKKDPLYYGIIQYQAPVFTFLNLNGHFDKYSQKQLYRQPYRVFLTFQGEPYSEALKAYQGRIKEFSNNFNTFVMRGEDPRESLSRQLPINTFSNSDTSNPFYDAGIDDKDDGTPVPIIFGPVTNGRAYRTSAGKWTFADTTFNSIDSGIVVVDKDGSGFVHGGIETDGTFTGADTTDNLYVTCRQSAVENGLDVISDNAANYESIPFTSAFYDLVEWNFEKTNIKTTGLWIGKGNLMTTADIIEQICVENNGIFDPLADGRFTFRTFNKNRFPTHEILNHETLTDGSIAHPANQILSSVKINYAEDLLTKEFRLVHNTDFQDEVYGIAGGYREKSKPWETRLTTKADASALSVKVMEQSKDIPDIVGIITKTQNISLRILDNLIYHYVRQNGNEMLPRSRFEVLGITLNLSNFWISITIKKIAEDTDEYLIMSGGDSETAYDYYSGGSAIDRPTGILRGRSLWPT